MFVFGENYFSWIFVKPLPAFGRNCLPGPRWLWLTDHIFHRATAALKNSGRAACFCYRTLEDVWHVITLRTGSAQEHCQHMVTPILSSLFPRMSSGREYSLVSKGNGYETQALWNVEQRRGKGLLTFKMSLCKIPWTVFVCHNRHACHDRTCVLWGRLWVPRRCLALGRRVQSQIAFRVSLSKFLHGHFQCYQWTFIVPIIN